MTNICIKWMNLKYRVRKAKRKRQQIAQFHFYAILEKRKYRDRKETNSFIGQGFCVWLSKRATGGCDVK